MHKLGFYMLPPRQAAAGFSDEFAREAARCFKDPTARQERISFNAFLHCRPFIKQACMQQLPEHIIPLISQLDGDSASWTAGLTLALTPAAVTQRYAAVSIAKWEGQAWKVPQHQVDLISVVSVAKRQNAPNYCGVTPQQQQYAALAATVIAIVTHQRHWTGRGSLPADLSNWVREKPRPPPMAPPGPLPTAADVHEQSPGPPQATESTSSPTRRWCSSSSWPRL